MNVAHYYIWRKYINLYCDVPFSSPPHPHPSFQDMVSYFGVKAKSGEKEVAPGYVFMLWYEFCNDFKSAWVRQSKNISKER